VNRFAALLDRLAYEPGRNSKLRLLGEYFRTTPDPDRGYALAAITGALTFRHAKPGIIRALIAERSDPMLFALSYDYVGDLSETVALMWPSAMTRPWRHPGGLLPSPAKRRGGVGGGGKCRTLPGSVIADNTPQPLPATRCARGWRGATARAATPSLSKVVTTLASLGKSELPAQLAAWLDALDETGRWALLKLVTGALRIGVSARLAKTAVAALGDKEPDELELCGTGWRRPTRSCLPGSRAVPTNRSATIRRRSARDAEPCDRAAGLPALDPSHFTAEWKWDGIRVQAVAGTADGKRVARLYSRTGEDISGAFPDLIDALDFDGAIDGELLILREGRVQSFNVLQQRLNRKTVNAKLLAEFPAHLRAYDLLVQGEPTCASLPSASGARGSKRCSQGSTMRASTSQPWCRSPPGTSSRPRAPIRLAPAQARCRGGRGRDAQAPRRALPAGRRRACGGSGSAIRT
jgi:DNA ligase-1